MKTVETRLRALETRILAEREPGFVLLVLPGETFEQARKKYEQGQGNTLTPEAFRRVLPSLDNVLVRIFEGNCTEEESSPWFDD